MTEHIFEYRPVGHHLNDFTFIRKGDVWHLFHITGRAPKGSPALSNERIAEGHATTKDFIHWKEEPHLIPGSAMDGSGHWISRTSALRASALPAGLTTWCF